MTVDYILQKVHSIWTEILEVESIDPDADFFDLGGDSLLALLVANRAIEEGIAMPRSAVLRHPTLNLLVKATETHFMSDVA